MRLTISLMVALVGAAALLVTLPDRRPADAQDTADTDVWMTDLDAARQQALEQKKPMLVVFR